MTTKDEYIKKLLELLETVAREDSGQHAMVVTIGKDRRGLSVFSVNASDEMMHLMAVAAASAIAEAYADLDKERILN